MPPWLAVVAVVLCTVYGQLIVKWQVEQAGALPATTSERIEFAVRLLIRPWVLTALFAGGVAAAAWMLALTRYELGEAYPFVSTTFALVLVGSAIFFGEAITWPKVLGLVLIALGLIVGSRG